VHYYLRLQVVY